MDYDNNLRGVLFKNDKATEENNQPQYRGSCEIEGKEFSISSWIKKSKSGMTFMSLSFEVKQPAESTESATKEAAVSADAPF
tara:strand:+ start:2519 stop:2764 length:246 start_codon:yes stop_codon:yes gene_type:complete